MKQYIAGNHLRLIGKGYEIRRELSRLAASAAGQEPLSQYTRTLPPVRAMLGSSNHALSHTLRSKLMLDGPGV
ncbi:MAG: hypothetical protein K0Q63_186 [Paenibacillus sp.]|jgi:hypothetical protein|nr:hypothetical protein [Paenibacillus sp.]